MSKIAPEPWPVLPEDHHEAPDGADRDDVEEHRLQRQQQRAEHPREQDVGDQQDDQDDPDEVAVDGLVEVGRARRGSADQHARRAGPPRRPRTARDVGGVVLLHREGVDDGGLAAAPLGRRSGPTAPRMPSTPAIVRTVASGSPSTTAMSYGDRAAAPMPEPVSWSSAVAGLARRRQRVGARGAGREAEDRDEQGAEDHHGDATHDPAAAHDQAAPRDPALAGVRGAAAEAHAVEPRADRGEDHREDGRSPPAR